MSTRNAFIFCAIKMTMCMEKIMLQYEFTTVYLTCEAGNIS